MDLLLFSLGKSTTITDGLDNFVFYYSYKTPITFLLALYLQNSSARVYINNYT